MPFTKHRPPVGARPGTLVIPEGAHEPRIHLFSYDEKTVDEKDITDVAEIAGAIEKSRVTWIDVQGTGDESVIRGLADVLTLHPLLIEDIVHTPQRPKVDAYDEHAFVVARMLTRPVEGDTRPYGDEQVGLIIGENWVLTVQERHGDVLDPVRKRIGAGKGPIRKSGCDYLAYAILDTIVDGYYAIVDGIGDQLEQLEDAVLASPDADVLARLYAVKQTLLGLRHILRPQRDAIRAFALRDEGTSIGPEVAVYLRDTVDHCMSLTEISETYREMASDLTNTYLSSLSNRMNEIMKVLTLMATIFIPLTFIAGVYGMNFDHMPELHVAWFYPALLIAMAVIAAVMLFVFRTRGWIGSPRVRDSAAPRP